MPDLTLTERYSIIALNAQDSTHMTQTKKAALRCSYAAQILDEYLDSPHSDFSELVARLKHSSSISTKALKQLEAEISGRLTEKGLMKQVPNLLGCDMSYITASVSMYEYCVESTEYARQTESMRAELMEAGTVTDEVICLLWLMRESSCFYDLFSKEEQKYLKDRINELYMESNLAKHLFPLEIHRGFEAFSQKFLKAKEELFTTQLGTGLLFMCPYLERSQSIFIEVEAWFSNPDQRLNDVLDRLRSQSHDVEILRGGSVPLLKIDNLYYECIPTQVVCKLPIQGVRLRRYIM